MRPSVGLVPTHPTDWVWDTLQVTGPMARTAEDVALMLQAIAGPSELLAVSRSRSTGRDFVRGARGARRNLRVAYCADIAGIGVDPDVERVCREAAFALDGQRARSSKRSSSISPPRGRRFWRCAGSGSSRRCSPRLDMQDRFGPNVGNNVRSGLEVTTSELAAAESVPRPICGTSSAKLFDDFDHLLTPCMAVPPFPVEQNYPDTIAGKPMQTYIDWIAPTFVLSLTGLPVASVPGGLDSSGMPVGLQIAGGQFGEEDVLAMAAQIQKLRPIGLPRSGEPPSPRLRRQSRTLPLRHPGNANGINTGSVRLSGNCRKCSSSCFCSRAFSSLPTKANFEMVRWRSSLARRI